MSRANQDAVEERDRVGSENSVALDAECKGCLENARVSQHTLLSLFKLRRLAALKAVNTSAIYAMSKAAGKLGPGL